MNKLANLFLNEEKRDKIVPFLSVLLGFLVGAIIMIISGFDPLEAYSKLIEGAGISAKGINIRRLGETIVQMSTLILTGLSVAFAFRTGLFNIGAAGQMLMGGFGAIVIGITMNLPKIIHLPLAIIVGILFGAIWASIQGILKAKFGVHEVVITIMMNWIAYWTVYYFVPKYLKGSYDTESKIIKPTASLRVGWLTDLFDGSNINIGIFLAFISVFIIWWILEKTTFGFELKAVGYNRFAARYSGMKVEKNIVYSMMISGALAGLAGVAYYIGYADNIKIGELPSQGYDGIAVALLGLNSPIGVVFSALLFGFMNAGKNFMQSATDVPNELVPIIMATIIFFAAANLLIKNWLNKLGKILNKNGGGK